MEQRVDVSGFLLTATKFGGGPERMRPLGPIWGNTGPLFPTDNDNGAKSAWATSRVQGLPTSSWDLIKLNCIWDIWLKWEKEK